VYGTVRSADVSPEDMEIFLHYTPSRDVQGNVSLTKLDPSTILSRTTNPNNIVGTEIFSGLYTLNLPASTFGAKGIYTIIIKPIEIRTRIVDCGVLSALPNVKGLVFDT